MLNKCSSSNSHRTFAQSHFDLFNDIKNVDNLLHKKLSLKPHARQHTQTHLSRMALYIGHSGQQTETTAGFGVKIITHATEEVRRFFQLLVRLLQ